MYISYIGPTARERKDLLVSYPSRAHFDFDYGSGAILLSGKRKGDYIALL